MVDVKSLFIKLYNRQNIDLIKDEKIVRVKASKRAKAYIRKVLTAKYKSKVINDNTILDRVVSQYESTIKDQSFESAGVFSNDGSIILQKDGEKDNVDFNKKEMKLCKGKIFTHNHPSNNSGFSPADIKFACKCEVKEMRAITPENEVCVIKMVDGSNFKPELWDNIENLSYVADKNIRIQFNKAINDGNMTIKEANKKHWNKVWVTVFEIISEIKYEVK
jgi:hypothetical protein